MRRRDTATFILCASLLCGAAAAATPSRGGAMRQSQIAAAGDYTATVKSGEARFTLPAPQRSAWRWRRNETKVRAREYMMEVKVSNEGHNYSFGFYLWKFPGATQSQGNLSSLIAAGQESLFESASNGHNIIVRDAGVKVRQEGDRVVITVKGRKNVARLFSGRPAQVTFDISLLDEPPTSQTVPVTYEN